MYEPFPGNYVWNLSVNIALGLGGAIGEIDAADRQVETAAAGGDDAGTAASSKRGTPWLSDLPHRGISRRRLATTSPRAASIAAHVSTL